MIENTGRATGPAFCLAPATAGVDDKEHREGQRPGSLRDSASPIRSFHQNQFRVCHTGREIHLEM